MTDKSASKMAVPHGRATSSLGGPIMLAVRLGMAAALCLNVGASIVVWRSGSFSARQKLYQFLLIWIIPFVGAVASLYVARDPASPVRGRYLEEMQREAAWSLTTRPDGSPIDAPGSNAGDGHS